MKNTLTDTHNLLQELKEYLSDPELELNPKRLDAAIKRSHAICRVVEQDIALENLRLDIIRTADALTDNTIVSQLPGYLEVVVDG